MYFSLFGTLKSFHCHVSAMAFFTKHVRCGEGMIMDKKTNIIIYSSMESEIE